MFACAVLSSFLLLASLCISWSVGAVVFFFNTIFAQWWDDLMQRIGSYVYVRGGSPSLRAEPQGIGLPSCLAFRFPRLGKRCRNDEGQPPPNSGGSPSMELVRRSFGVLGRCSMCLEYVGELVYTLGSLAEFCLGGHLANWSFRRVSVAPCIETHSRI